MTENDRDIASPAMQPTDAVAGRQARAPWLVGIMGVVLSVAALGWAIVRMT